MTWHSVYEQTTDAVQHITVARTRANLYRQVCPRPRGKRAALLGQLATPRARPKPARLARPTRAIGIPNSKVTTGYNGAPHICPQNYPFPLPDPQTPVTASTMDPSDLPSQTASGSDQPFFHKALDRQTDRQTERKTDQQNVNGKV